MLPLAHDVVQLVSGALGVHHLSLPYELVVLGELALLDPELQELHGRVYLLQGGALVNKVTHEGYTYTSIVVVVGVGTGEVPTAALVHVTVAAYLEKVIIDLLVSKSIRLINRLTIIQLIDLKNRLVN